MSDLTLSEAATRFAQSLKSASGKNVLQEVNRFVNWYGAARPVSKLRPHDVSQYADVLGPSTPENSRRADHVRAFLSFLKKDGLTEASLSSHLRLRKSSNKQQPAAAAEQRAIELTGEGVEALKAELEELKEQRIAVREEIRKAMLDKDFRENAPLDAAKDKQGHQEARIREIEAILKRVVIVDAAEASDRVRVGTTVQVRNLGSGTVNRFVIVGPTEANAADGKISSVSPVGKALLDRGEGDEVEVSVPAGNMRLRIEQIEAS